MSRREWYTEKNITVLPFLRLLDDYVGQRLVHYVTIDIEGFEYPLLDQIIPGKKLAVQGIAFCQIDVELHPVRTDGNKSIKEFLQQFMVPGSNYLPIYHAQSLYNHHKVTFINIDRMECQKMFDITRYLK